MNEPLRRPGFDFIAKFVLSLLVITIADRIFTLYDSYWQLVLTSIVVATVGLILDWVVLPRIGSFPTLYVDKMAFLLVISLLSLGMSNFTIVPFYVAEAIAIVLALFEEGLHRAVLPKSFHLET